VDDKTRNMIITLGAGIAKKGLTTLGSAAVAHGIISGSQTETFISLGMALVGIAWSFWDDYGRAIVLSQLEVLKAKSLAQAAKIKDAGLSQVTAVQIAEQSSKVTPAEVVKTVATMPDIQANVAPSAATVSKIAGAILLAIMIGSLWPDPASAQGLPKIRPLTGNIINDLGTTATDKSSTALNSLGAALAKPFNDIANFIGEDADAAVALATMIPNLQDGHGQQCWIAMQSFGAIIKAHPVPITFHVINDYESLRLLGMATNNLCSNVHCTQVFADFSAMAVAASPVPLAIPSLHDLCTKVPQIAVVDPIKIAAPVPPITDTAPTPAKP
jgi:hypothetical protein